jgi:hypothetical protein
VIRPQGGFMKGKTLPQRQTALVSLLDLRFGAERTDTAGLTGARDDCGRLALGMCDLPRESPLVQTGFL